jgi:hypothetical protein
VGLLAIRQALAPLNWAGQFLRNPLRWSSRVAPSGPVVLQEIQRLQRLETCRYNGQVVVRGDTGGLLPTWLAGDRLLFLGRGEVVAGMDLARLHPDDVQVSGDSVELRLPPAEVLHTALDNRQSEVYERRSGLLSGPDRDLETRVRQEAEENIRRAALDRGLLAAADANARDLVRSHLSLLGFREVRFR